jgi:hypothetical protein
MKKIILTVVLMASAYAIGQQVSKLWVHKEYSDSSIRVYYVQDIETGTRCYVVSQDNISHPSDGNAISCVKEK